MTASDQTVGYSRNKKMVAAAAVWMLQCGHFGTRQGTAGWEAVSSFLLLLKRWKTATVSVRFWPNLSPSSRRRVLVRSGRHLTPFYNIWGKKVFGG